MHGLQSNTNGDELLHIYTILLKINQVYVNESRGEKSLNKLSLFPDLFLFKLLDDKLAYIDGLAAAQISKLLKRLTKKSNREKHSELWSENLPNNSSEELHEYFYSCIYYLYDPVLELEWYKPINLDSISKRESDFVSTKLQYLSAFIIFRKSLTQSTISTIPKSSTDSKEIPQSVSKNSKNLKSSLSVGGSRGGSSKSNRIDLPTNKRRIRFNISTADKDEINFKKGIETNEAIRRSLKESQSIFALELLIYALNIFIERMLNQLLDWANSSSAINMKNSLSMINNSKQRLRTNQLRSISKQMKNLNYVYLSTLNIIAAFKKNYLIDKVLGVICLQDTERIVEFYKTPRINAFLERVQLIFEKKLISRLVEQCLQLILDLIINEINLPPIELITRAKTESKEQLTKSRDNHINFITSWLKMDDVVKSGVIMKQDSLHSTLDEFKSSSRILAQMYNLHELILLLVNYIVERLQSENMSRYFLDLVSTGLVTSFNTIRDQLLSLSVDFNESNTSLDTISFKVRCVKFIQIFSSLDKYLLKKKLDRSLFEFLNESGLFKL